MVGMATMAFARSSPPNKAVRTNGDERGWTNPRLTIRVTATAVDTVLTPSSMPAPLGSGGTKPLRGSAASAALLKTSRYVGRLQPGLKTLGVQGPLGPRIFPPPLPPPLPPRLIVVRYGAGQPLSDGPRQGGVNVTEIVPEPRLPQEVSMPKLVQFTALGSLVKGIQPMELISQGMLGVQPPLARAAGLMQAGPVFRGGHPGWPGQRPRGSTLSMGSWRT